MYSAQNQSTDLHGPQVAVTDYLDEKYLAAEIRGRRYEGFEASDIKYAALSLMLNPNALTARFILMDYGYQHILHSEDDARRAAVSLAIGRVARGIHIYDRHKYPLIGFLQLCYDRAYRDLFAGLEKNRIGSLPADFRTPAWEDTRGGGSKRNTDIHLEKLVGSLLDTPQGSETRFPMKRRAADGGREPVPYFLYSMSEDELQEALNRCKDEKRPVNLAMTGYPLLLKPSELAAQMDAFAEWYRGRRDKNGERNLYLFRLYQLEGYNIDALLADKKAGSFPGRLTNATVRYAIYDKMLPAFALFQLEKLKN